MVCITPCIEWEMRSRDTTLEWSAATRLLLFGIRLLLVERGAEYAVAEYLYVSDSKTCNRAGYAPLMHVLITSLDARVSGKAQDPHSIH